jgi:hypothetical protein
MTDRSLGLRVTGLRELRKALKEADAAAPKALQRANKTVAEDIAAASRSSASAQGSTLARVVPSIRAVATASSAGVRVGSAAHPEALGAVFGGQGRQTTQQFRPHRGRQAYAVYPQIRERRAQIETTYSDVVDAVIAEHFPH